MQILTPSWQCLHQACLDVQFTCLVHQHCSSLTPAPVSQPCSAWQLCSRISLSALQLQHMRVLPMADALSLALCDSRPTVQHACWKLVLLSNMDVTAAYLNFSRNAISGVCSQPCSSSCSAALVSGCRVQQGFCFYSLGHVLQFCSASAGLVMQNPRMTCSWRCKCPSGLMAVMCTSPLGSNSFMLLCVTQSASPGLTG